MPISVDDNDFPASNDDTLNLIQIVKSQAHLLKQITGKDSWIEYPDSSIQEILAKLANYGLLIDSLQTNIANSINAINAINAIARPRILWKTPRSQNFTVGTSNLTMYEFQIPAGTCNIDSILKLSIDVYFGNTTPTKRFFVTCNGAQIINLVGGQNAWFPIRKNISFNGALNAPTTIEPTAFGYTAGNISPMTFAADFSNQQTIRIYANAGASGQAIAILNATLELF